MSNCEYTEKTILGFNAKNLTKEDIEFLMSEIKSIYPISVFKSTEDIYKPTITPEEARSIAKRNCDLKDVYDKIRKASLDGYFDIILELKSNQVEALRMNGFTVQYHSRSICSESYNVSWSE